MPVKGVIFDLGNTLVYFAGDWSEVFARADQGLAARLVQSGLDLDPDQFVADFRERLRDYHDQRERDLIEHSTARILEDTLAAHGYPSVAKKVKADALAALYAASQKFWLPEDDLLPTLEELQLGGYRMGVISNAGDDRDVQTLVDQARVRPFLEYVLTSAASGMRKPDHRIFALGLQFFGLSPGEVVMVGDTLNADILGANLMGITSVWITRRANTVVNRAYREKIKPTAVIEDLADLPGLLRSL